MFNSKKFPTEDLAKDFLLKQYSGTIHFLISEYNCDKDCVECDLLQTIEGEDFGDYSEYEVNKIRIDRVVSEIIEYSRG